MFIMEAKHPSVVETMKKTLAIPEKTEDAALNVVLDTLGKKKQAIVFVNTKPSAESMAERVAASIKKNDLSTYGIDMQKALALKERILGAVTPPTRQCKREAGCIEKGIAFHHAGLHADQKQAIEDAFRSGVVKIICATPTLAMGVDLPAFRTIIRDLKRYGKRGLQPIPVLEYEQQAGRAGRPGMEDYGEAIIFSETEDERERLVDKYINGESENITSKLAVEPILRMYVLSLVASEFIRARKGLRAFFEKTFYAHQYGDTQRLHDLLDGIIMQLQEWEFLKHTDEEFRSASSIDDDPLDATLLGKRVSELYLDPYTAHQLILQMQVAAAREKIPAEGMLFMINRCLEMRPLPRVKASEMEIVEGFLNTLSGRLFEKEPEMFDEEYEDFLGAVKQTLLFVDWTEEKQEEYLLETYNTRPGELHEKLSNADWLLYGASEIAKLLAFNNVHREALRLRTRLDYGAKEELLPLLRLKGIGRIRARMLFQNKIKDLGDIKSVDGSTLVHLLGKQLAIDIKKQVGEEIRPEHLKVKENKRKGQMNLNDYDEDETKTK